MTLDNETQRQFLLEMMRQVSIPGAHLDTAYAVKQAIVNATVPEPAREPEALKD